MQEDNGIWLTTKTFATITQEIITAQCDTKGKGTDYFVMPVLQKYGEDYYCVDCVCDNTADYEMQYENASNTLVNNQVQECEFERNAGGDRVAMEVNKRVENKGWICNIDSAPGSGAILVNVIVAADRLIVPISDKFSIAGAKKLTQIIRANHKAIEGKYLLTKQTKFELSKHS